METKTENTAVETATSNLKRAYSFDNLLAVKVSLSLFKSLQKKGVINETEYQEIRIIILSNHDLNSNTIMA